MPLQITKTDSTYGNFFVDAYTILTPKRSKMAPTPEKYAGLDETITTGTKISRHFTLSDFTGAERTRTLLKDATAVEPAQALKNMQRLCFEALDPATDYVGVRPTIVSGLASHDNGNRANYNPTIADTSIVGDSIFEAFARGEGVALQYDDDNENRLFKLSLYIRASCIFDRCVLRYTTGREEPSLIVTVNEKGRRLCYTAQDQAIVSKGITFLDG